MATDTTGGVTLARWLWRGIRAVAGVALASALAGSVSADAPVRSDLIGMPALHTIGANETLHDVARQHDLGFVELRAANPQISDPWLPGEGTIVSLPKAHLLPDAPRKGIVVNLADFRLYYFPKGNAAPVSFPIGIARSGSPIPIGTTTIVAKRVNPTWFPPPSVRAEHPDLPASVPPGPENPLGDFALSLGWPNYVIHGTNKPDGVGRRVSHGCIRMYPEDIEALFAMVRIGTPVTTVDQPVKAGISGGALYLEAHPTKEEADEIEADGHLKTPAPFDARAYLQTKAGASIGDVDWELVDRIAWQRRGIPMRITPGMPSVLPGQYSQTAP